MGVKVAGKYTLTVQIPNELAAKFEAKAKATGRTRTWLVLRGIEMAMEKYCQDADVVDSAYLTEEDDSIEAK